MTQNEVQEEKQEGAVEKEVMKEEVEVKEEEEGKELDGEKKENEQNEEEDREVKEVQEEVKNCVVEVEEKVMKEEKEVEVKEREEGKELESGKQENEQNEEEDREEKEVQEEVKEGGDRGDIQECQRQETTGSDSKERKKVHWNEERLAVERRYEKESRDGGQHQQEERRERVGEGQRPRPQREGRQHMQKGPQWRERENERRGERACWREPKQGERRMGKNGRLPGNTHRLRAEDWTETRDSLKNETPGSGDRKQQCERRGGIHWDSGCLIVGKSRIGWAGNDSREGGQSHGKERGETVDNRQRPHPHTEKNQHMQRGAQWGEGRRERACWRDTSQGERETRENARPGNKYRLDTFRAENWADSWESLKNEIPGSGDRKQQCERRGGIYWDNGCLVVENSGMGWARNDSRKGRQNQ